MDNFHGDPMKQPFQSKEMMQNFRIALIVFILTATAFLALPAQEKAPPPAPVAKAVVFPIQGQLSKTMPMTLKRAVKQAKARGAETLIIEIDTPGGEIMLMEQLRDLVFEAYQKDGLETVAFINPNADSAGALVSMACRQVYMSPLAHIGSATPVQVSPIPIPEEYIPAGQEDMMNKVKSRARAIFRATAIETDRNPDIAEAMVDPDLELVLALIDGEEKVMTRQHFTETLEREGKNKVEEYSIICASGDLLNMTAREALDWGFIDGIPNTRDEFFREFLGILPENVYTVTPSWSEKLVHFIESIHFLLLIAGVILLYVEFQMPGFGLPGIIGLACLALLFFDKWLIGLAEITEILMILLGMGLLVVKIFVIPGTFVAGILGAVLILAGLVLSFQPFILPASPWESDLLQQNIVNLSGAVIIIVICSIVLSRFLPKTSVFRRLVLDTAQGPGTLHGTAGAVDDVRPGLNLSVGDRGKAQSYLRPSGKVLINDTVIDAQSEGGFIEAGEDVQIVRITGNFIFVRKSKGNQP